MNAPITTALLAPATQGNHDRSQFLGGSDAAAVMGLSPWATPVELWQRKLGIAPPERPDPAAIKRHARGHKLEPFIVEMAVDKLVDMGMQVEVVRCNARYNDPEFHFLSCEIDFELILTGEALIGDEYVTFDHEHINGDAKSVSGFARKKWGEVDTEDVPIEYAAQFMHGLMVTGRRYCVVAALRSFDDVDIFWTVRDDETIAAMRPKLVDFWVDHVLTKTPPDPIKFSDIKLLFPLDNGQPIEATPEIAEKVTRLVDAKRAKKNAEEIEEALTFDIGEFISPNSTLTYRGAVLATWNGQNDRRIDQKALQEAEPEIAEKFTTSKIIRVLRLKTSKKGR